MTNAEKYLKDGVSVEEFARELCSELPFGDVMPRNIIEALNKPITPTLTEDEKVILRNIDKKFYTLIFRNECLFITGKHTSALLFTQYDHLFQFIKERRRILY